jgi:MYXO-CTERM domain-containing protein
VAFDSLSAVVIDQAGAAGDVTQIDDRGPGIRVYTPAAAFDGAAYLVVWHNQLQVLGQRVDADGAFIGERFPIADDHIMYYTTVRFGGGNHLVVWESNDGIFATRVTPDGQVLDPEGKLLVEEDASSPFGTSLAFDGRSFVLAWAARTIPNDATSVDLFGAEVGTDGEVLRKLTISEEPESEDRPFLAAGADGQVLAAYSRFVAGAPNEARRARARLLASELPAPPAPDAGPPGPAPDAGGSPVDPPGSPGGDDGCGCRTGADQPAPLASMLLLAVAVLWLVRRRRAR